MNIVYSGGAKLVYYSDKEFVTLTFQDLPESKTLKKHSSLLVEMLSTNKTKKILVDTTNVTSVKLSDILWLSESIAQVIKEYSIEKIAFVSPQSVIGLVSLKLLIKLSKCEGTEIFKQLEEAEVWLFGQQPQFA